jgi:hypothetical protein
VLGLTDSATMPNGATVAKLEQLRQLQEHRWEKVELLAIYIGNVSAITKEVFSVQPFYITRKNQDWGDMVTMSTGWRRYCSRPRSGDRAESTYGRGRFPGITLRRANR